MLEIGPFPSLSLLSLLFPLLPYSLHPSSLPLSLSSPSSIHPIISLSSPLSPPPSLPISPLPPQLRSHSNSLSAPGDQHRLSLRLPHTSTGRWRAGCWSSRLKTAIWSATAIVSLREQRAHSVIYMTLVIIL